MRGLATLLVALAALPTFALDVPYLAGRINDQAGLLPDEARQRLETKLADLEAHTSAQVAVLTVASLEGEAVEDFSVRVAETWKLGQQGKDNGVLFLVARDDRRMRLEVGYGLEGVLTDATTGRILDGVVRPRFRAGDFAAGIEDGVDAIAAVVEGGPEALPEAPSNDLSDAPVGVRAVAALLFLVTVGLFSLLAVAATGCAAWFLYLFLMPFWGFFPAAFIHPSAGVVTFLAWLIGFPVVKLWLTRTPAGKAFMKRHRGFATLAGSGSAGSSGWSSGWSSGGSSGGFSGGGGSFGGGGASSSW